MKMRYRKRRKESDKRKYILEEAMSEKKIQVTLGNYKGSRGKKNQRIIITEEEVKAELERRKTDMR